MTNILYNTCYLSHFTSFAPTNHENLFSLKNKLKQMTVRAVFYKNRYFFIPYATCLLVALMLLLIYSKSAIHLFINSHYTTVADFLFRYLTTLGSGLFGAGVGIVFLLVSFRKSLFIFLTWAGSGIFVQILKRVFFPHALRPVKFFEGVYNLHLADGVHIRQYFSFPSGHAATAFGLFLCLAIMTRNHGLKLICFVMAALVAFSRIYLSQHFLIDICFGSLAGSGFALLFYFLVFLSEKKWLDRSIILFKEKK